jgi:hypothetical protein
MNRLNDETAIQDDLDYQLSHVGSFLESFGAAEATDLDDWNDLVRFAPMIGRICPRAWAAIIPHRSWAAIALAQGLDGAPTNTPVPRNGR